MENELQRTEAIERYLRRGIIPKQRSLVSKNGIFLPTRMSDCIFAKCREYPLQNLITRETTGSLKNKVPFRYSNITLDWVEEGESFPLANFELGGKEFIFNKAGGIIKISENLFLDSYFNVQDFISTSFGHALGEELEKVFIAGDANKKPAGFIHDCSKVDASGPNITTIDIQRVFTTLKTKYIENASWLVSQKVFFDLDVLADDNGNKLMSPGSSEADGYLLGKPVHITFMPEYNPLSFGDYSYYKALDKPLELKRLNELFVVEGFIGFRLVYFADGKLLDSDAIVTLEI